MTNSHALCKSYRLKRKRKKISQRLSQLRRLFGTGYWSMVTSQSGPESMYITDSYVCVHVYQSLTYEFVLLQEL